MKHFLLGLACLASVSFGVVPDDVLINGQPSLAYPQIVYIQQKDGRCTGTLISPRGATGVILTAGHCVEDGGKVSPVGNAQVLFGKSKYTATCTMTPEYKKSEMDFDLALCVVDRKLWIAGAKVSMDPVKKGTLIQLSGYGCTRSDAKGGNDGVLRIGLARVTQDASKDTWFYTLADKEHKSALCSGDSGGPALSVDASIPTVIGVNSRANLLDLSLFTALSTPEIKSFMEAWAKDNKASICGLNTGC